MCCRIRSGWSGPGVSKRNRMSCSGMKTGEVVITALLQMTPAYY